MFCYQYVLCFTVNMFSFFSLLQVLDVLIIKTDDSDRVFSVVVSDIINAICDMYGFSQAHGIRNLVLPTRDYLFAPSLIDICQAVDFIHGK